MDIKSAKYLISSPDVGHCPAPDKPEYAFIGRSNVGKSSLINMITRNASLAKTSASPGKTQMINHFTITPGILSASSYPGAKATPKAGTKTGAAGYSAEDKVPLASFSERLDPFYFVDLPGYGFAKRSQSQRAEWKKMIAGYLQERENLMTTFVLIDSRLTPQPNDLNFLKQLGEWQVPFNMVFTKADKTNQREVAKNVRSFIDAMREEWEFIPRSFVTSAMKFRGRKELLGYLAELNEAFYGREKEDENNGNALL